MDALTPDQQQATEDRVEALGYLASISIVKKATNENMVSWLNAQGPTTDKAGCVADEFTRTVVSEVARTLNIAAPRNVTLSSINSPECIFHWSVMVNVLKRLA